MHCPHGALSNGQAGIIIYRTLCIACGECVKECYACALVLAGRDAMAEEVMDTVLRDRVFYENSGGGVTFSNGEPMLQHNFLKELLVLCRTHSIDTAIETAGNVPCECFEELLDLTDLFLFDVKRVDDCVHRRGSGAGCNLIQRNLEELLWHNVKGVGEDSGDTEL